MQKKDPVSPVDCFIQDAAVNDVLKKLKNKYGERYENLIVSDVIDSDGHQYVDLVQEGGGVLGIALLGYTYILENAGIRFRRLAGTSAGAINTAMLTVIGKKNEQKSPESLKYLCEKNLFDFVDGHPSARWLIKNFIKRKNFFLKVRGLIRNLFLILAGLLLFDIIAVWFSGNEKWLQVTKIVSLVTLIYIFILGCFTLYTLYLLRRFRRANYGIARGDDFIKWLKKIMSDWGVTNVDELNAKAAAMPENISLRDTRYGENTEGLVSDVTFIASEVITENKIEFPKMWNLFASEKNKIHPAEFVRASMSIPFFFKSHFIQNIPRTERAVMDAWKDTLGVVQVPTMARFVDGGILSNFPVSIFYNKDIEVPRMPTFGIRLDESDPEKEDVPDESQLSFGGYIRRIFNTARFYYDKDFLIKNKMYNRGIMKINVHGFNWLNFYMKEKDRVALFVKGAQAAGEFLENFDWEAYKHDRTEGHKKLENQNNAAV